MAMLRTARVRLGLLDETIARLREEPDTVWHG